MILDAHLPEMGAASLRAIRVALRTDVAPLYALRWSEEHLMELYLFRLSLKEKAQRLAFERLKPDGTLFTREEWIRDFLSQRREFRHRGTLFVFVPDLAASANQLPKPIIAGWIARARLLKERTPPHEGLLPTEHESWRVALLLADPTEHADGQKVAVEQNQDIGDAKAVARSLARAMGDPTLEGRYSVEAFPIIQDASFWRFAERHAFQIRSLTFDVAVPNMFDGPDDFSEELKKLRDRNNTARVKTTLVSDGSLDTKEKNIAPIIDYTEKGLGTVRAKATDGARYNSQDHVKRVSVDAARSGSDPSFWSAVRDALGKIF